MRVRLARGRAIAELRRRRRVSLYPHGALISSTVTPPPGRRTGYSSVVRSLLAHGLFEPLVVAGMVVVATLVRLSTFGQPLLEAHGFRQTQTAYTALIYHEQGISLLHSPLPVLGRPFDVPFEFPLFQALAALVMDLGVRPDVAMRVTAYACFLVTAGLLYGFTRRFAGRVAAVVALFAFLFSPFALLWSRASLIEFMATAGAIGFAWAAIEWRERRVLWLVPLAVASGSIAFLVKVTTGAVFVIPILAYVSSREHRSPRGWIRERANLPLAFMCLTPLALAALWTRHADRIKERGLFTRWLTSDQLTEWNFGTLDQRLDLDNWRLIADRVVLSQFGGVVVLAIALAGLWRAPNRSLWVGWTLAGLAAVLIFFNLHLAHDYYQAAISPIAASLIGLGGAAFVRLFARGWRPSVLLVVAALVTVSTAAAVWQNRGNWARAWTDADTFSTLRTADELADRTSPDELIVVLGLDWSPELLYYARRRGTMLRAYDLPQDGVAQLPDEHRFVFSANPLLDQLEVLELWNWARPVAEGFYRTGIDPSELGPGLVSVTSDRAAVLRATSRGRRIAGRSVVSCTGAGLTIPAASGTRWVRLAPATTDARLIVEGSPSVVPVEEALVLDAGAPGAVVLTCVGAGSVTVEAVVVTPSLR